MITSRLQRALGQHGFWKLAQEVKRAEGLAPPQTVTLESAVSSLSLKFAADLVNERVIARGIEAYRKVRET
jgi:hypothetical protein